MGRFAEERRAFLADLNDRGHGLRTLRNVNKLLLVIAERVNVRQAGEIAEARIVRAARSWVAKSCAPSSTPETREAATKRFIYVAKNWFRFLGKWRDPDRNPQFKPEIDSFLKELRNEKRIYRPNRFHARSGPEPLLRMAWEAGTSIAVLREKYGVNASMVHCWLYREGRLGQSKVKGVHLLRWR